MLELCLLMYSQEVYDYRAKRLNVKEVEDRLNIVKNKYPLGIYYILKEMLEKSPEHRLPFSQLQNKLPTNFKNNS